MESAIKICVILVCLVTVKASSYRGRFAGYCMGDGIYYSDGESFVLCSGGYPSRQQCAPGTKNAPFSEINARVAYFCGVRQTSSYQSHSHPAPGHPVSSHSAPMQSHQPPMSSHSAPMQSHQPPMSSHSAPMQSHQPRMSSHSAPSPSYNPPKMPSYTPQMPVQSLPAPSHSAPQPRYPSHSPRSTSAQPSSYRGRYTGSCPSDGMYYKDDSTFVMCSGGNGYVTPCPPGTINHPAFQFTGREFCGVNLVDNQIVMSYPVPKY